MELTVCCCPIGFFDQPLDLIYYNHVLCYFSWRGHAITDEMNYQFPYS